MDVGGAATVQVTACRARSSIIKNEIMQLSRLGRTIARDVDH